jgi:glycerol-3-phosphate O-acyltransferase
MAYTLSKWMLLARWLSKLFSSIIRTKAFPQRLLESLNLNKDLPVVYILRNQSLTDFFVLDHHCRQSGLPRPHHYAPSVYPSDGSPTALYLRKTGLLQQQRQEALPLQFQQMMARSASQQRDIQIVPVSVFWGRNPGSEDKSLLKTLFFDSENGGRLHKIFLFLLNGRHVLCDFGKPFSLEELRSSPRPLDDEDAAKKLNRLLRVHFRRQREIVLGPQAYLQKDVVKKLLDSPPVREIIALEANKKGATLGKTRDRARTYAYEVTSRLSHNIFRFFDMILPRVFSRIYNDIEVVGIEKVRALAKDYELVYMPCHRSHMDYLLLGYVLYFHGLMSPHTVAGNNLNFWPVGPLLRRGGAIFIRRTFSGNVLYSKIVSEFVHYLIDAGFPICFYPEGGRSRTGLLLEPKTGILGMVLESHYRKVPRPIMLVPVFISYDKLMESKNYLKELGGNKKSKESFGQLLKAGKVLGSQFGNAYINFGEPIDLASHLDQRVQSTNEQEKIEPQGRRQLKSIAHSVMVHINQAAVINPSAIFSLILLATPKKALSLDHLLAIESILIKLAIAAAPQREYGPSTGVLSRETHGNPAMHHKASITTYQQFSATLPGLEKYLDLERFHHPTGDIIYAPGNKSGALHYYRNNIVHFFVLPSLITNLLRHNNGLSAEDLQEGCKILYRFFNERFFLTAQPAHFSQVVSALLQELVASKLVVWNYDSGLYQRPNILSNEYSFFKILCNIHGSQLERIGIYALTTIRYGAHSRLLHSALTAEYTLIATRLALLSESQDAADIPTNDAQIFLQTLANFSLVRLGQEQVIVNPSFIAIRHYFAALLSWEIASSFNPLDSSSTTTGIL